MRSGLPLAQADFCIKAFRPWNSRASQDVLIARFKLLFAGFAEDVIGMIHENRQEWF